MNEKNKIDKIDSDCYFCSDTIDPKIEEIGPKTKLCLLCKLKLCNFIKALDINPAIIFKDIPEPIQKTRIKLRMDNTDDNKNSTN